MYNESVNQYLCITHKWINQPMNQLQAVYLCNNQSAWSVQSYYRQFLEKMLRFIREQPINYKLVETSYELINSFKTVYSNYM